VGEVSHHVESPNVGAPRVSTERLPADRWDYLVLVATSFTVLAFLVHEICSLDVWWHVTIGRDILSTWSIPRLDRYSVAGMGRPYHDSHWLFQVMLAVSHRLMGWVGVQVAMISAWGAALYLCYLGTRRWASPLPAAVLVFVSAMVSVERFIPRPEVVTFFCIALFQLLLLHRRYLTIRDLSVLALAQVVWANSHGLFVIGPFMIGCYWIIAGWERLRRKTSDFSAISRALAVVLIATVITPFGLRGWRYAGLLFSEIGSDAPLILQSLGELGGTFGRAARDAPAFWFFLVLLAATCVAVAVSLWQRRLSPRLLILFGMTLASFSGRRNVVLLALVAAPFLAEVAEGRLEVPRNWSRRISATAAILMLVWSYFPLSGAYYVRMEIPARVGFGATKSFFPHQLREFLDSIEFRGRIYNSNTLGGFYLYHGFPDRLPLIDGRWEVFDSEKLVEILSASRDRSAWRRLTAEFDFDGVLLAHTSSEAETLVTILHEEVDWRPVYYDQAASFWLRESYPNLAPAIDLDDPTTLPQLNRVDDGLILDAFLNSAAAKALRVVNLQRTLEFGVRRGFLLEELGSLQVDMQLWDDAEASFSELLSLDPEHTVALNELAFLAYNRGDLQRSAELMERALTIEPENLELRQNYERVRDSLRRGTPDGN
jgi:hypothetical protein